MIRANIILILFFAISSTATDLQILYQDINTQINEKIYVGENKEILRLPDYGTVINHQLSYFQKILGDWPCVPERQKVKFKNQISEDIIGEFSKEYFENHFTDGVFEGTIPQILAFAHLDNAIALISSTGNLTIVGVDYNPLDEKSLSLKQLFSLDFSDLKQKFNQISSAYLAFDHRKQELIFISNKISVIMQVEDNKVKKYRKIHEQGFPDTIQAISVIEDYVCLALGENGLECLRVDYDLKKDHFKFVSTFKTKDYYVTDVRVNNYSDQTYNLYILDKKSGIIIYQLIVHGDVELLAKQIQMPPIGQSNGIAFDVYRNSMMMIRKTQNYYTLHDYHVDLQNQTWIELNRWVFQSEIRDVDLTQDFAIVIGHSGHHIIYHSVHKDFYQETYNYNIDKKSESALYLPNLLEIDFLAKDLEAQHQNLRNHHSNVIFGITRHKLIALQWELQPISIRCQTDSQNFVDINHLSMVYYLNSTQCPVKTDQENDMQMCKSKFYLNVNFVKPILNRNAVYIVYLIVASIFIVMGLIIYLIVRRYKFYSTKRNSIEQEIHMFAKEGIHIEQEEQPSKQSTYPQYQPAQLNSNAKTPNSENVILQQ